MPWWGVASAIAAPLVLIGGWTYAETLQPAGFDGVQMGVSSLAALDSPSHLPMTIALVLLGLCHIVTALGLRSADVAGRWVLAFGGAAMILVAARPDRTMETSYLGHVLPSELALGALALWPAVSARQGPAVPWPLGRRLSVAVSAVLFVLLVSAALGLVLGTGDFGLRERVLYAAQASWPLVVAATTNLTVPRREPAGTSPRR